MDYWDPDSRPKGWLFEWITIVNSPAKGPETQLSWNQDGGFDKYRTSACLWIYNYHGIKREDPEGWFFMGIKIVN